MKKKTYICQKAAFQNVEKHSSTSVKKYKLYNMRWAKDLKRQFKEEYLYILT